MNERAVKIDMIVVVPDSVPAQQVYSGFISWIEANAWQCSGSVIPCETPSLHDEANS
jgi:hypothetical protein